MPLLHIRLLSIFNSPFILCTTDPPSITQSRFIIVIWQQDNNLKMSRFQSTVIDQNFKELQGGKEIKPPLIPSNTQKIYSNPGIYNLKGFYEDLNLRLQKQKETLLRIQQSSRKNLNVTNQSMMTVTASRP